MNEPREDKINVDGMEGFLQAHFAMIPPLRTRLSYCLLLFCHLPFGFWYT